MQRHIDGASLAAPPTESARPLPHATLHVVIRTLLLLSQIPTEPAGAPPSLLRSPGLLRRVATARGAHEALELLLLEAEARDVVEAGIQEEDCARLISAALEQGECCT